MRVCSACVCARVLWVSLLLLGVGCSKSAPTTSTVFQSAPPEVKKSWDTAIAAMKTNGYAVALLELKNLTAQPSLTPAQKKVAEETATIFNDQMYAAANKDDPKAKQAINDLRDVWRR